MKFLTRKDIPGEALNRVWTTGLKIHYYEKGINFEWGRYLVQYKGQPTNTWVGGYIFRVHLFDWKVKSDHFWYDGPHCAWHVGPFTVFRDGGSCDKCSNRD